MHASYRPGDVAPSEKHRASGRGEDRAHRPERERRSEERAEGVERARSARVARIVTDHDAVAGVLPDLTILEEHERAAGARREANVDVRRSVFFADDDAGRAFGASDELPRARARETGRGDQHEPDRKEDGTFESRQHPTASRLKEF